MENNKGLIIGIIGLIIVMIGGTYAYYRWNSTSNINVSVKISGNTVTFDQVIAVSDNTLKVGADVANATVTATVMEQGRGKKVIVYKYKRKTGYHKKNGHRQAYTEVKIEKINA